MRSILLNIIPDLGHETRLATAIALAKSCGAHVTCLQTLIQPLAIGAPDSVAVLPEMMRTIEWSASAFKEEIEARLKTEGIAWDWIESYGDPATIIVRHARLADVVILSTKDSYPSVGSVALHARIPVLAAPVAGGGLRVGSPVLIAWNGSHPSANALRASLPLLREAEGVHILAVDRDSEQFPAARALAYLAHHDVAAEVHWQHGEGKSVAETILAFALQVDAGTLVAGAFGHNRFREMLLGSVTRALLKESPIPLLLTH